MSFPAQSLPRLGLAVACLAVASCTGSPGSDDGDDDVPHDDTGEVARDDGLDADADEASPQDDAAVPETCEGVPVRCGRVCCTADYMDAYWREHEPCDPTWWSCMTHAVADGFLRVDASVLPHLPALAGWTYRADGSELYLQAGWASPRWWLECANWCWPNGSIVYLLDATTEELLHVERIPTEVAIATFEWLLTYPLERDCPAGESSVPCVAVDVPERAVSYVFNDPFLVDGLPDSPERLANLPTLRCALQVMDLARRVRLRCIDLQVPE